MVELYDDAYSDDPDFTINLGSSDFDSLPIPLTEKIVVKSEETYSGRAILISEPDGCLNTVRIDMERPSEEAVLSYFDPSIDDLEEQTGNEVLTGMVENQRDHTFDWVEDSRI